MSGQEILAILLGLFFGYLLVAKFSASGVPKPDSGRQSGQGRPQDASSSGAGNYREEAPQPDRQEPSRAWHDVLDVPADASVDEIRLAYRSLVSKYHPDKVASMGPELQAICEAKSKEINAAYDEAMKLRSAG